MNAARNYINNILDAVITTFKGLRVTAKYWLFEPSITVEYPDRLYATAISKGLTKEDLVFERFRGFLGFEPTKCIACMQCQRVCPIDCIRVTTEKREEGRYITGFDVNQLKCMHCGLCVEECPTEAVFFTKRYEGACFNSEELCFSHVVEPALAAKRVVQQSEGQG